MTNKAFSVSLCALAIGLTGESAAWSQGAAPLPETAGPATASSAPINANEIVVTARKRAETLQNVPLSVTAINSALMERNDIRRVEQIGAVTPNVVMKPNGATATNLTVFIRGIGTRVSEPSQDNPIVLGVDGVYLPGQAGTLVDLFDVQQVEVLRGPQGTLQGRNSPGGAVNVTTRRPTNEFEGRIEGSYMRFDQRILRGVVNIPIVDGVLAMRVIGTYDHGGNFMTNIQRGKRLFGATNSEGGRVGILFTPSSTVTAYLTADYSNGDPTQSPARAVPHRGNLPLEQEPTVCTRFNICAPLGGKYENASNFTEGSHTRDYGTALNLDVETGVGTLTSVTGYRNNYENVRFDVDNTPLIVQETRDRILKQSSFSQEVRFASNPGKLTYIFGGLAATHRFSFFTAGLTAPNTPLRLAKRSQTANTYALFGQLSYELTEPWSVTVGGRQTWDKKVLFSEPVSPGPHDQFTGKFSNFSYELGSDYKFSPDHMAYIRYATGYRAGGVNGSASSLAAVNLYDPEKVAAFEGGLKTQWLDRKLTFNLAVFHYRYKDLQVTANAPFVGGFTTRIVNARGLNIKGIELETVINPFDNLSLKGSLGYLDAKYRKQILDLGSNLGPLDISKLKKENAPKWTAYIGADYTIPLSELGELTLSADMNYQSTTPTSTIPNPVSIQEGYALVNGSITFKDAADRFSIAVFGRNLTNKYYVLTGSTVGSTAIYESPGRPRTYGVRASVNF